MFPLNTQPVEKVQGPCDHLEVHSCWHTFQGEGPDAGTPAVFLRLSGCTLACPSCDTEYTSKRDRLTHRAIMYMITQQRRGATSLVVVTGGEPFRQHLKELLLRLRNAGLRVQIETNGTIGPDYLYESMPVSIVCSPKTPKVHELLHPYVGAYKYVLDHAHVSKTDGLPAQTLGMPNPARPPAGFKGTVFVQPMDSKDAEENEKNVLAATRSCVEHGYRLSLQLHKILGLE